LTKPLDILFLNDSPVIRHGLAAGFESLGHRVRYLLPDIKPVRAPTKTYLWELGPAQQVEAVRKWINEHPPPSFFVYEGFTGVDPIHPAATQLLSERTGAPFYYWAIEDPLWTAEVVNQRGRLGPYACVANHIFTTAVECSRRYQNAGISSSVLQFGCNPRFHRKTTPDPERSCDLLLIANFYPGRSSWLSEWIIAPAWEYCRAHGLTFHIYGHGWDAQAQALGFSGGETGPLRGPLAYQDLPKVYSGAQVALGAEQCLNESETQCSMRVFEALGCAACYLGPRHRAHQALFADRKDLVFTESAQETFWLLDWLLNDRRVREAIAASGRQCCYSEHTYTHRASDILRVHGF
jgi:spore maturation protein CgeB